MVDNWVVFDNLVVGWFFYILLVGLLLSGCDCGIWYEYVWIVVVMWYVYG